MQTYTQYSVVPWLILLPLELVLPYQATLHLQLLQRQTWKSRGYEKEQEQKHEHKQQPQNHLGKQNKQMNICRMLFYTTSSHLSLYICLWLYLTAVSQTEIWCLQFFATAYTLKIKTFPQLAKPKSWSKTQAQICTTKSNIKQLQTFCKTLHTLICKTLNTFICIWNSKFIISLPCNTKTKWTHLWPNWFDTATRWEHTDTGFGTHLSDLQTHKKATDQLSTTKM